MTEHITWHWQDEENNILYIKYKSGWTWTEHHTVINEMMELGGAESEDFIYVIIDMIDASFPRGTPVNSQRRDVGEDRLMIMLTNNVFVRTIGRMGIKVLRDEHLYRFVNTVEEANEIVQNHIETRRMQESSLN